MALVPVKVFVARLAFLVSANTVADADRATVQAVVDAAQNDVVVAIQASLQALPIPQKARSKPLHLF